MSPALKSE
jgi:hypothetical protein